jgi:hypothetical protein
MLDNVVIRFVDDPYLWSRGHDILDIEHWVHWMIPDPSVELNIPDTEADRIPDTSAVDNRCVS